MRRHIQLAGAGLAVCASLLTGANAQRGSSGGKNTGSLSGVPLPTMPTGPQPTVYYLGKVVMDTGMAPPSSVAVLRVCNGYRHREAYTSGDGSFSIITGGQANTASSDAGEDPRELGPNIQPARTNPMMLGQNDFQSPIADCELRADLPGYTSSSIRLDPSMGNSNVGVIVLHNRSKKADGMISVASLEVPAKARREYEKGSELLEKGDLADAEKSLRKAIDQYPKFAEAWLRLGDLEQRRKNTNGARKDYQEAVNADPNFPLPFLRMAFLSATAQDWEQTCKLTEHLIGLDPVNYPLAYYYGAIAEFNLKHVDKAESDALRAETLDKQHSEPGVEVVLATIYNAKGAYPLAADHYRAYLKLVPRGPLAERVKIDLAKTEELAKSQAPHAAPVNR